MWIRYTKEDYELLRKICEHDNISGELARWIKKIVDANEEEEDFRRRR